MAILDCRDTQISLWQEGSALHSPGFVMLEGSEYHFGQAAFEQSRLRPRDTNSRFWWQLSTQPLKPALGAARHTADLVHSHLRHIHSTAGAPSALVLAVPDSMPKEQLSLLLGVAQASDFKVAGLVSRSVLIASNSAALAQAGKAIHLETQLNQTIINELLVEDGKLRVVRSTPLPACGLLALQERCVSAIASAFIQQTRFDPRRSASSEQNLYNQLPSILATLRERGEASVDIDGHRSRITAGALASASERLIKSLQQSRQTSDVPILLDPELHLLPGIEGLKGETNTLPANALWEAFITQREHVELPGEDLHLVDQLAPVGSQAESRGTLHAAPSETPSDTLLSNPSPVESVASQGKATHVLLGTLALPLRDEQVLLSGGFSLRQSNGHWTLHGDGGLINGMPSTPQQPLSLGDTLSLGTAGHGRLIEVQS
ncbi:hypothetical protein R0135_14835 [Congregibacter variabilis]|uniref:Uncharacterized protein n=1 Tax=Congregibacter variabilis TaxID=3081200 RepID=A0ABZ0I2J6_9GAMM|nr:hypothetical protein R0135_14835 [Congregibacter sp. IMCC43200]